MRSIDRQSGEEIPARRWMAALSPMPAESCRMGAMIWAMILTAIALRVAGRGCRRS